jgi:hypothetical protein
MHPVAADERLHAMLYWIAEACKEARIEAGRHQVHIAASLSTNQSTIFRFEEHEGQPRSIDATVAAYGDDLKLDPRQLWARALEMWIAGEEPAAEEVARGVRGIQRIARTAGDDPDLSAAELEAGPSGDDSADDAGQSGERSR